MLTGKISRAEWREWARQKREMMQRFNSEKEALVADNKRLRASMDPSVRGCVSPRLPVCGTVLMVTVRCGSLASL